MKLETMSEPVLEENIQGKSIPSASSNSPNLLIVSIEHWKFILSFTVAVAILAAIIAFLLPNKYTATTVILPPSQNASMSSAMMSQVMGSGALASLAGASMGIRNPSEMYVAFFHSRSVEDALIQRYDLMTRYHAKKMSGTRKALEKQSSVILGSKDGLIRVTVTDRDPKFAAELANAWIDELRKHTNSLSITEASQRRAFFQQQLLEASDNLTKAEEAMKKTEQSTGVLQFDSQARALIEQAAILRAQITAKEVQLQSMRSFATVDNPQYAMAQQQLEALRAQLAKVAGAGGSSGSDVGVSKANIPEAGITYLNSLRDVRYYETIEELLAKQFEAAKLDESREGVIQVSDPAVPPDNRSFPPRRAIIIFISTLLGFCVACGLVVLLEKVRNLMQDSENREVLEAFWAIFS